MNFVTGSCVTILILIITVQSNIVFGQELSSEELFENAVEEIKSSNFEQALILFDKILESEPDNFVVLNNKGNVLIELGRFNEAVSVFEKIVKTDPQNPTALANMGVALIEIKQYNKAIEIFDRILQSDPTNKKALENRKVAFSKIGTSPITNSKFIANVLTQVRNSDGMLISVTKSNAISFRNHPLTDEFLNQYPVEEIVSLKGNSYEKRIVKTKYITFGDAFVSTARLVSEKFNDPIIVFTSLNHAHTVETGDVISAKWTIFKLVS